MKIKKILIYCLTGIILFQDTFVSITNISVFKNIDEIITIISIIILIGIIVQRKKIKKNSAILIVLVLLFSIIGIISCYINSEFVFSRVIISNILSIKFFILILSIMNINFNEKTKKYIVDALLFFSKIVMIFAIFNFVFPVEYAKIFEFAKVRYRMNLPTVYSLFTTPQKYGWFMLFIAIYHYSNYNITKSKKELYNFVITAIFSMLSLRTKCIIGLIAILIYDNIINKRISIKRLSISLISIFILCVTFKDAIYNTYTLYFTESEGTSARQVLNNNGIRILKEYFPLGVGFGKYGTWYAKIYYSEYYYKYRMSDIYGLRPENSMYACDTFWPSIYGETGVLGTIIYLMCLLYIMKNLCIKRKNISTEESTMKKILINMSILTFIQSICESFGEPSFYSAPQYIFLAIVIGMALDNREK